MCFSKSEGKNALPEEVTKTVCFVIANEYVKDCVFDLDGGLRF